MSSTVALEADCARCFGLCCVALAFSRSADFAIDKPSGEACRHLSSDFRCEIHADLRERGFPGCTVFDCLGAGQQVSQVIYAGRDWRTYPESGQQMFDVFARVRELHMLLWHVHEALQMSAARPMQSELDEAERKLRELSSGTPEAVLALDVGDQTRAIRDLLRRVSELARAGTPTPHMDFANKDLIGAKLAGANLRGASLRGARLIEADLRRADLRLADFTAADMRNADLRGANLTEALFLRQSQLVAARGDTDTRLPVHRHRPSHWLHA